MDLKKAENYLNKELGFVKNTLISYHEVIKAMAKYAESEAINYSRCCTQLKDKEVNNFYEWLVFNNYSYYRDEMFYDEDDNIWFESQLEEKYKKEHNL